VIPEPPILFLDECFHEQWIYLLKAAFHPPLLIPGEKSMNQVPIPVKDKLGVWDANFKRKDKVYKEKDKKASDEYPECLA